MARNETDGAGSNEKGTYSKLRTYGYIITVLLALLPVFHYKGSLGKGLRT